MVLFCTLCSRFSVSADLSEHVLRSSVAGRRQVFDGRSGRIPTDDGVVYDRHATDLSR